MSSLRHFALAAVLVQAIPNNKNVVNDYEGYNSFAYGVSPNQTYKSSPVVAPLFQVSTWNKKAVDPAPYIFTSVLSPVGDSTPATYIFQSSDLSLVYAAHTDNPDLTTANVRPQKLNGKTYLTYWRDATGNATRGCGFYNEQYELVYDLKPVGLGPEIILDIHECQVTHDNTVLLSIYASRPIDATSVGGPANGSLIDSLFQEVDPVTNALLFTWRAIDHFDISDSYVPYEVITTGGATGWDWTHLNSVDKTPAGDYLVSCRHTHIISLHSGKDGSTIWRLGGKRNQFADLSGGLATGFAWQHDARFRSAPGHPGQLLSMFDNRGDEGTIGCDPSVPGAKCSRGLLLALDAERMTAKVEQETFHPAGLISDFAGGYEELPAARNVLLGWGSNPTFTEHKATGECVWDVQFAPWGSNAGYRTYKGSWTGTPTWPPAAVVEGGVVYVSWNGATEVRYWSVYTSDESGSEKSMKQGLVVPKSGFETAIRVASTARYVQVVALGSDGQVLPNGSSAIIPVQ